MPLAPLIRDLAFILGVAALVTLIFSIIRQPVVLGYIAAGMIVGPSGPTTMAIVDVEGVRVWAELGVIFFMFALGLEFSFRRLGKVGGAAVMTALVEVAGLMALGYGAARWLGWQPLAAWFIGCMVCVSSTTIIMKTFADAGLKTRRFAELVVGILVVEDLAAIVMLVALTNIAATAQVNSVGVLVAGAKLGLVVGTWLLVGWFIVPRMMRVVARRGTNELLIVASLGLCLALATASAYFHYSVALGAFIMGSILAETREAERTYSLVAPLRDLFGAIFFVSVGMLLDPTVILHHFGAVLLLAAVVVIGNTVLVSLAAMAAGQGLATAISAGFSMVQIGEFSFIIANLGIVYGVLTTDAYAVIVAVSLLTTFVTPYMIQSAPIVASTLAHRLPPRLINALASYESWCQREGAHVREQAAIRPVLMRWLANAVLVVTLFTLSADLVYPRLASWSFGSTAARTVAWLLAFTASAPFLWGMLSTYKPRQAAGFRGGRRSAVMLISGVLTVLLLGVLSVNFFPVLIATLLTIAAAFAVLMTFRHQFERYYQWFERTFVAGIGAGDTHHQRRHRHLVPWDGHLAEIPVGVGPFFAGKTLFELQLRERFGLNIVVIKRGDEELVAPSATERVYPHDILLCFATDAELAQLMAEITRLQRQVKAARTASSYVLRPVSLQAASALAGRTIREAGIREVYDCILVGIERKGTRMPSPKSNLALSPGDLLWVVGDAARMTSFAAAVAGE